MKTLRFAGLFLLSTLFLLTTAFTPAETPASHEAPPRWERLGQRKVNRRLDRDEIVVTAREGIFSAVKLRVRNSGINLHRMVIHYRNGETQDVTLRQNIPAGGETRVIDLPGRKRVIKKVVFWYDTKGLINDKAVVALWGRH